MVTAIVVPKGKAQDLDTLAAALEAEDGVDTAVEDIDVPEVQDGRASITVVRDGEAEVATIDDGDSSSGSGTVDVDGGNAAWAFDDDAATLKAAIEALTEVTTTVAITGTGAVATPFVITFGDEASHTVGVTQGTLENAPSYTETNDGVDPVPEIEAAIAAMVGDPGKALVFQFHVGGATSGTGVLTIGADTCDIEFNDADTDVDTAITAMTTVTACAVSGDGTLVAPFVVTITEVGDKDGVSVAPGTLAGGVLPRLQVHVAGEDAVVGAVLASGTSIA